MKQAKRIITFVAVTALLLSMASCALLGNKSKLTQEITAGNIRLTIRSDMKEQDEIKNDDNYITGFRWEGYGLNIGNIEANDATTVKFAGMSGDDILKKVAKQSHFSDVQKFGDISFIEYDYSSDGKDYINTVYITEEGYEYYFFEFYTLSQDIDKYREEYEKIITSVAIIEEPAKTAEVTINGVTLTMDGDAFEQSSDTWICSRYSVTVMNTNMSSSAITPEEFVKQLLASNSDTQDTTYKFTNGGSPYFIAKADDLYAHHYVKDLDGNLYYFMISTMVPKDVELILVYNDLVDAAHLA